MISRHVFSGREAFVVWLRTGRIVPCRVAVGLELKFNPWYDVRTGRFTEVGRRKYFGPGGGARGSTKERGSDRAGGTRDAATARMDPVDQVAYARDSEREAQRLRRTWRGGGFTGGGGGAFGGVGATSREIWSKANPRSQIPHTAGKAAHPGKSPNGAVVPRTAVVVQSRPAEKLRSVERNGYRYDIDAANRTRHVSGEIATLTVSKRSRATQKRAGGVDRRSTDDGGHYIASRFNGPAEAFNHFAQDANFNRGRYRALEDQWARAKRLGQKVRVRIVPEYVDLSKRPVSINIWFDIDGKQNSVKLTNGRPDKEHGQ